MKIAVPLVVQQDLSTTRSIVGTAVEAQSDAYGLAAQPEVLQTTIEMRQGRFRVQGTVTDLSTQRVRDVFVLTRNSSSELISVLNELAKRIDQGAGSFSTGKEEALNAYVRAITSPGSEARIAGLQKAIDLDPAFGLAYLALAQMQLQTNSPGSSQTVANAARHRAQFIPLDQARLDSFIKRALHANLAEQASATQALVNLIPNDVEALTLLGSEEFLLGNASNGEQLLRRALSANPDDQNVRQQLALGFIQAKQFQAAEKVLAGLENSPTLLPEFAVCALLRGDLARANMIFLRYLDLLQSSNDPAAPLSHANWVAVTQSPAKAAEYLKRSKFASADLQSLALSQATIYALIGGDTSAAKASASASLRAAVAPIAKAFAIAAFLTAGSDAPVEQFRTTVNASPLDPGTRNVVLAYGLFFRKHYTDSAEVWKEIVKLSGDTDLRNRAMLAAALDRSGQSQQAEAIHVQPFVPNLTGGDEFGVAAFQEMRRLLKLQMQ